MSQISWHSYKSPWRTKARHGLTSLQPNAHTGLQRVWPLCLGLLKRKGNSRLVSALPGSLLTSRLVLHNWPYRVLECPCSACAMPMFSGCLRVWSLQECVPPTTLSFPSIHGLALVPKSKERSFLKCTGYVSSSLIRNLSLSPGTSAKTKPPGAKEKSLLTSGVLTRGFQSL